MPHFSLKKTHKLWSSLCFFFLTINIVYSFIRRSFSSPLILLPPSVSSSFLLSVGHPWSIQALWRHAPLTSQHLVSSRQLHTHSYTHTHTHTHIQHLTYSVRSKRVLKCLFLLKKSVCSLKSNHLYKIYLFGHPEWEKLLVSQLYQLLLSKKRQSHSASHSSKTECWIQCWRLRVSRWSERSGHGPVTDPLHTTVKG